MSENESRTPSGGIPVPRATKGSRVGYLTEVRRELAKVDWPTPKETIRLTGIVFAVVGIATLTIYLMSLASDILVKLVQGRV